MAALASSMISTEVSLDDPLPEPQPLGDLRSLVAGSVERENLAAAIGQPSVDLLDQLRQLAVVLAGDHLLVDLARS